MSAFIARGRAIASAVLAVVLASCAVAQAAGMPEHAMTLSLDDVLRRVEANNPSLESMRQAVEVSRARADAAGAWNDPELRAGLAPASLGAGEPRTGWRVGVMQRLPIGGENGARRASAVAESEAKAGDFAAARLDLVREARAAFAEYRRAETSLVAHVAMVDLARQVREVSLARYAAGTVSQQDPLRAGVEAARLAHHQARLESEKRASIARLNALLGETSTHSLPPPAPGDTADAMAGMASLDVDSLVALASRTRPELGASIARVSARVADRNAVDRSKWPGLSLGLTYDAMWDEPKHRTMVEMALELPFGGGRSDLGLASEHAIAESEADYRATVLRVQREVIEAAASYDEAVHELDVLTHGVVPAAEQAALAAKADYEANRGDVGTLLEALRTMSESRLETIDALARRDVARADLARAVGVDPPAPAMGDMR